MDDSIKGILLEAYGRHAEDRDERPVAGWKQTERAAFVQLLRAEGKRVLLDVGSGTGKDSEYFVEEGLLPVATDICPEMLRFCRRKTLASIRTDCYKLSFREESLEAVWSMNVLLHVPSSSLSDVLSEIRSVLKPGGLFYLGLWGGDGFEGVWEDDHYTPKRFFSFRTDSEIDRAVRSWFEPISFRDVNPWGGKAHLQSTVWRKP